ncbi:MAG: hypothetical protein KGZ43_08075 [Sulfuritalea sp.]|nr:hypothetical protein [Sulfuritalea sp.]
MTDGAEEIVHSETFQRRFRSFVARPAEPPPPLPEPADAGAEDDVPLLTDIVDAQALDRRDVANLLASLRDEIDGEVSAWLAQALPAAVSTASQQLLDELDGKARHNLLPRLAALIDAQRGEAERIDGQPPSL